MHEYIKGLQTASGNFLNMRELKPVIVEPADRQLKLF
jgi:hypothetical protein